MNAMRHILLALALWALLSCNALASATKTVTIDTPDLCTTIEKVAGSKVYMKSGQGACPSRGAGKTQVAVPASAGEIELYVNGKPWKKQSTASFDIGDIPERMGAARKAAEKMTISENANKGSAMGKAADLHYYYQSRDFQDRVEAEKNRLQKHVFGDALQSYYPASKNTRKRGKLSARERIYIFISSSMPRATLRNYVQAVSILKDPNVRIIMRGFIGGVKHIKPTISFLKDILLEDPGCSPLKEACRTFGVQVMVDPMLFAKYDVKKVPAVVYAPSVSVLDDKMSEGLDSNITVSQHYMLYGDVSLEYAVEQFLKETPSGGLEALRSSFRHGYYQ